MNANRFGHWAGAWIVALLVFCFCPRIASAADFIAFGGFQHTGDITLKSAINSGSGLIHNLTPGTFGVFGARVAHGHLFGGEYTGEYAPNFISSDNHAWIFHGNLRVQIPYAKVIRPYATGGVGLLYSAGSSTNALGTEFLFNYGGGIIFSLGPVGLNFDVRGYTVPSAHISGVELQNNINFVQPTVGLVISF